MYTEGQRLSFLLITIYEHTVIIHIGWSKKGRKVTPSRKSPVLREDKKKPEIFYKSTQS